MPPPILSKAAVWLKSHQERLVDAGLLLLALHVPALLPGLAPLPLLAKGVALVALALCSSAKVQAGESRWRRYAQVLPGYAVAMAATLGLFLFWLNLPARAGWFAVIWLGLTALARLPWPAIGRTTLARLRDRRLDLPLTDLALALVLAWAAPRWTGLPAFSATWLALLGIGWLVVNDLTRAHLPSRSAAWHAAAAAVLAAAWAGLWGHDGGAAAGVFGAWLGVAVLLFRLAARRWAANGQGGVTETLRWLGLLAAGVLCLHPFLRSGIHGTGDALYYATFLADALGQFRAGVFPVFVGQTEFQFNGSVIPIRVAPGFQYLGGLLDLLTARTLGPIGVQNALIFLVGLAVPFAAYASLRRLRSPAWAAWVLAFLYLTCPGTLGLAFNTDLYMSWLTTPFVPVALALGLITFAQGGAGRYAALGAVLGFTFWLHAPIAIWLTLVSAGLQAVRFAVVRPAFSEARREVLAGASAFAAVACYPLISALLYPADPTAGANGTLIVLADHVVQQLVTTFPASWLPLSAEGRVLTDFQLGYGLLAAGACAWLARGSRMGAAQCGLLAAAVGLVLLLLPIPWLSLKLWSLVPSAILTATNVWVMQRLYVVLAGVLVAALALRLASGPSRVLPGLLVLASLWSAAEATKFLRGSWASTTAESYNARALLPENVTLTRYSYGLFAEKPAYFTHGVTDPAMENRLLRDDLRTPYEGNFLAAARQAAERPAAPLFLGIEADRLETPRPARLEPGARYLLEFIVPADLATLEGTLIIEGRQVRRVYGLPEYGESRSFGLGGDHPAWLPLHTTASDGDDVRVRFVPNDPAQLPGLANRLAVRVSRYDAGALPIRVENWLPYTAAVRAPAAGWLETPRMYQAEYRATVDGRPVEIMRSFQGLATVPVPAGASRVTLAFVPPRGLAAAFWFSLAAIGLGAAAAAGGLFRRSAPATAPDAA